MYWIEAGKKINQTNVSVNMIRLQRCKPTRVIFCFVAIDTDNVDVILSFKL